jgi:O-acetyl-ADP-ribose deacetylase (regulator of RNase III)
MNSRIELIQGDITQLEVDAIVNAANTGRRGGGGVDGAIHRAGGPRIMEECRTIGGCPIGDAVVTSGGNLKAHFVIHAVGPIWQGGNSNEDDTLASAYRNSLNRVVERKIKTVAFPNISTGIYGFPRQRAAEVAIREVEKFLQTNDAIRKIIFCCFDRENYDIYQKLLKQG